MFSFAQLRLYNLNVNTWDINVDYFPHTKLKKKIRITRDILEKQTLSFKWKSM